MSPVKLESVRVRGLGPIRDAVIPGKPVVLFLGPNGAGKSTLLDSLGVLYFGTRGGVSVKENAKLTQDGEKSWIVEAEVTTADGLQVLRAIPSDRPLQSHLKGIFGDPRAFRALLGTGGFLDMTAADRKAMLADLTASDSSVLAELLESENAPPEIVDYVRKGNLKGAHRVAQQLRRAADSALKSFEELAGNPVPDPLVPVKGGDQPVSQVPADKIRQAIGKLEERRMAAVRAQAAVQQYESVKAQAATYRKQLEGLNAEASWDDSDHRRLDEIRRNLGTLREAISKANAESVVWVDQAERFGKLKKKGGECPTCGCELSGKEHAARLENLRVLALDAVEERRKETEKNLKDVKELEAEGVELTKRRGAWEREQAQRTRIQNALDAFEKVEAPPPDALNAEALKVELDRLKGILFARDKYDAQVAEYEEAKTKIGKLKASRERFATFENLCDPSKLENEADVVQTFNGYLGDCSEVLFGDRSSVLMHASFEVSIRHRAVGLAADSEVLRAGLACNLALARLSGIGIVFIDRLESLDDDSRKTTMKLLYLATSKGWVNHAWVAAVKKNPVASASVPWLAWLSVQQGTVVSI